MMKFFKIKIKFINLKEKKKIFKMREITIKNNLMLSWPTGLNRTKAIPMVVIMIKVKAYKKMITKKYFLLLELMIKIIINNKVIAKK